MINDTVIVATLGLIGSIVVPIITYRIAVEKTKFDYNNESLQKRYHLIYCPLRKLIINTHITSCGIGYPFNYRLKKTLKLITQKRLHQAFDFLRNNFESSVTHEIEYGDDFPFDEIQKNVKNNIQWADAKIVHLIEKADRALYENREVEFSGYLCNENFELATHIFYTYEKLNKRLLPK